MDKALETQLVKQKERFQALFEYASMGILVADDKGVIQMANNYLLNQFGYTKEELIEQPVEMLIPARYEQKHHLHREHYNKHPEPRSMGVGRDLFARKKDGSEFPVEVSLSNYSMDDRKYIIAFVIDITARKQIENSIISQKEQLAENNLKIEEMNQELEQKVALRTQQLQDAMREVENSRDELKKALSKEKELGDLKTRFVSMASHEFRTPLSTILSSASLLAKYQETSEQEKRDKHINRIKTSVNNLTDILNEFLSIGKIEDGRITTRYSSFNLKNYIQNICSEMKAVAKKNQHLNYTHTGEEVIQSDESLLRNIIFNLLSNAIKFSSEDGIIRVSSIVEKGGFVINIKDNGIGISEEDKQHLFERFFRASNATNIQGTGLGLHIVSKYVEMLDGSIHFESELEKGSTFTITFKNLQ
ncbi:MAG: PAS domain-containing sensor histidine kinase [Ferruginibacter sp.]